MEARHRGNQTGARGKRTHKGVSGEYYDTSAIVEFIVWWKKGKVPDEERTYKRLVLDDRRGTYGYFAESQSEFERARKYALGLLNADNAVYPSAEHSALTLTCREMASRFHGDYRLGEFGAAMLQGGDGTLAKVLSKALDVKRPDDPLTTIVWPLLSKDGRPDRGLENISKTLRRKQHQSYLREFQAAAKTLADHEEQQGNRLRTLERIVHFVCIATHAHAQALSAGGDLEARRPLLMALAAEKRGECAIASEQSLDRMYSKFEAWLVNQEAERIRAKRALTRDETLEEVSSDGRTARRVLRQILSAKIADTEPDSGTLDARMEDFEDAKRRTEGTMLRC